MRPNLTAVMTKLSALALLCLSTSCLDLPVMGTVDGEGLQAILTSVALTNDQLLELDLNGQARVPLPGAMQLLISEQDSSCDTVSNVLYPVAGRNTLVLSLEPKEGEAIQPGEYRVEASEDALGSLKASFLVGTDAGVEEKLPTSGVLLVESVDGAQVTGKLILRFTNETGEEESFDGRVKTFPCEALETTF